MSEELKPCPFCGSKPTVTNGMFWAARCLSDICPAQVMAVGTTYEDMAKNWNRRTVNTDALRKIANDLDRQECYPLSIQQSKGVIAERIRKEAGL